MKKTIAALSIATLFAIPSTASADWEAEMKASDRVEIKLLNRGYRSYNPTAVCDQQGRSKFYCSFVGSSDDCFLSGKAYVRNPGYRVQILSLKKSCF